MFRQYEYTIEYRLPSSMAALMPSADDQLVPTCRLIEKKETMMLIPCAQSELSTPSCSYTLETDNDNDNDNEFFI